MDSERPEWKQRALEEFVAWLDGLPAEPPDDLPADPAADLYALAAELTALKQETRTLGRATAQLAQSSRTISENLQTELPRLLRIHAAPPPPPPGTETLASARRAAEHPFLVELGDLSAALSELQSRETTLDWPAFVPRALRRRVEASRDQPLQVLALRLDALLKRHHLETVAKIGQRFDATGMNATGISTEGTVEPACVSGIVRQGYRRGTETIRIAEVIIEETAP